MQCLCLYPAIKPFVTHKLAVEEPHKIYLEECGIPEGVPILFVHGGPGIGCTMDDRRFFDPERYHIILFDQRGCGRSTPYVCMKNNTTPHLIQDMERIREHLGIKKWMLFGGSWGSTLSLAYAQQYPERVLGLILRGVFLCRAKDFHWFYQDGASHIFPDYWQEFIRIIPETERGDLLQAYHKRLIGDDEVARMSAAKHWAQWEGQCATLHPSKAVYNRLVHSHTALSLSCIETHYFTNNAFLTPNQLLHNAHKLENIPGIIVHGRYDMICPLDNAHALYNLWPHTELHVVRDSGHSACEPGNCAALINATNVMIRDYA